MIFDARKIKRSVSERSTDLGMLIRTCGEEAALYFTHPSDTTSSGYPSALMLAPVHLAYRPRHKSRCNTRSRGASESRRQIQAERVKNRLRHRRGCVGRTGSQPDGNSTEGREQLNRPIIRVSQDSH